MAFLSNDILKTYKLNNPFYYEPHPLCVEAAHDVIADIASHPEWREEVEAGKMFGVLVTESGVLKAYSGQILGRGDWDGYVPAVFNYLDEDGYFKIHEAEIVATNKRIEAMSCSEELRNARDTLYDIERETRESIEKYKIFMAERKWERERKRSEGNADDEMLIRESQFQKAELRRLKAECREKVSAAQNALQELQNRISAMKRERKHRSDDLQNWLFRNFNMKNGRGEVKNLLDIFREWASRNGSKCVVPPSGSGECCAPKLFQYAFENALKPLAVAEFTVENGQPCWQGACMSRCAPILDWMLQGVDVMPNPLHEQEEVKALNVLYEDENIIVVDKPAGMLSVPGKSKRKSALDILREMRPDCDNLMMAHRLDMQTSGVLVAAKNMEMYRSLQADFAEHLKIKKSYVALLEGVLPMEEGIKGEICLPLSADYLDRPRQKVDHEKGKYALTKYEIKGVVNGHTLVVLYPVTGRTHQLRVHCASKDGLGMPILGDDLYGHHDKRLYLHAESIRLNESCIVTCKNDFLRQMKATDENVKK